MRGDMSFITMVITMYILLNSFAQVPVFVALLANFDSKKQKKLL